MLLGVIADDFTGATDIAGFLVSQGLSTIQLNGVPDSIALVDADAVVISLKSRSCPVDEAVSQSLAALAWLQQKGVEQVFFKYCSTFDSTAQGNIGPVTDALMAKMGVACTVIAPALPVNGRDVFNGQLFVNGVPLNESGMRHHPVTPMEDADLVRLMSRQARGRCGLIRWQTVEQGAVAVGTELQEATRQGFAYVVLDAFREQHLTTLGEALRTLPLVTGGSGLGAGLARAWAASTGKTCSDARKEGQPLAGPAIVLSGSCSEMTRRQVAHYRELAPARQVMVADCIARPLEYMAELAEWVMAQAPSSLAPMLYATTPPEELQQIALQYGSARANAAIEQCFGALAVRLRQQGFCRFIVAGGETSGVVTQALAVKGFHIGPQIAPGVPWVKALDGSLSLALKSGNFGAEPFFSQAQECCYD